ncbi:MAG: hypothetical protein RLZ86_766 [Actinomycetota bacterium]
MTPASPAFVERFPVSDGTVGHVTVADGVSLRVVERRPSLVDTSLPTVLLVHGLASNARMWDGVAAALTTQAVRSIAVDLRGHGRSDRPTTGYDFGTIGADLCRLLDAFDLDRAVVVGQSWGGNVVVDLAHRHPDRVVGAVAVDGGMIDLQRSFPEWDDCARALQPPRLAGTRAGRMEAAIRSMHADWPESGIIGALSNPTERALRRDRAPGPLPAGRLGRRRLDRQQRSRGRRGFASPGARTRALVPSRPSRRPRSTPGPGDRGPDGESTKRFPLMIGVCS